MGDIRLSETSCRIYTYISWPSLTLVHAGVLVFENGEFVNLAKLLEHRAESVLFEMARYLSDEELDGTLAVAGRRGCGHGYQHLLVSGKSSLRAVCQTSPSRCTPNARFALSILDAGHRSARGVVSGQF